MAGTTGGQSTETNLQGGTSSSGNIASELKFGNKFTSKNSGFSVPDYAWIILGALGVVYLVRRKK